jgi:hypothetical protein
MSTTWGAIWTWPFIPLEQMPVTAFSQDPRGFAFWFNQPDWLGGDALYMTMDRFADDDPIFGPPI